MKRRLRFSVVSAAAMAAAWGVAGCFVIADLGRFQEEDAATSDSGAQGAGAQDAWMGGADALAEGGRGDASGGTMGGPDGRGPDGPWLDAAVPDSGGSFYDLTDPQRWSFFDVTGAGGSTSYSGVVFDGRYLYFVPQFNPPNVLRYDTHGGFTDPAAWTFFAPTAAIVAAGGLATGSFTYLGGAFDGRYVYLAPFGTNTYALQYDTQGSFAAGASWSAFQGSTLDSKANYWGVVSDGRYAYFMPNATTTVVAYDNTAAGDAGSGFGSSSSWTTYNLGTGSTYGGFWGGLYTGHTLYMVPYSTNVASSHDTSLPVTSPSAWNTGPSGFDLNNNEQITPPHYWSAAYDGSRLYLIPYKTQAWTLAAYTTSGPFTDDGSWATCALQTQLFGGAGSSTGFVGSAFDGKRLILAPIGQVTAPDGGAAPLPVVAYDTTQPLCPSDVTSAYTTFDPTTLAGGATAQGFEGAAFDGHYVYFVPHQGSVVARFEARGSSSGLSPPGYRGSWW